MEMLELATEVSRVVAAYDPLAAAITADNLRGLWLQFEPKSVAGIKAEQRGLQETIGTPVPVLRMLGKEVARVARRRVADFVPLTRLLWDSYGREGRVVALIALGAMELVDPDMMIPLVMEICRTCVTWEDADRVAMDALEPIVRKRPEQWLGAVEPWLTNGNKWVRRAGVIVVGRLPMKHPSYTTRCLELLEGVLCDEDVDVRKAVSFAIRLAARGEAAAVGDFLRRQVPPKDASATWVLCDVIRSMTSQFLPEFLPLLPLYEDWAGQPGLSGADRRSVDSAIRVLRSMKR